ncbi:MAG: nucleotidyl transferase AbiEii/AbiGii toxin family protein, partial [Christensenellaceae bacterium]|nr:nucleotidyl transferase AbiEii/AbiGii toxin family protein [Christensenellaceae bacterium]
MAIFTKQYIELLSKETNFLKDNLEKVLRLANILQYINSDCFFKNRLILKGGSAINLTILNLPRLSVDIDFDFGENICKDAIKDARIQIRQRLIAYMQNEGYFLKTTIREHYILDSIQFHYFNNTGNPDTIKIEINYLDRVHIFNPEYKVVCNRILKSEFSILTLNITELYASKV